MKTLIVMLLAALLGSALQAQVCGDAVREGTENCDDGNTNNLDGCSATCTFEQALRATSLEMQFATDADCTANAFGGAIKSFAQSQINNSLSAGVADGSISLLLQMLDLDDFLGVSDPTLQVGVLGGTAVTGAGYNGTSDLDWWYTADPSMLTGDGLAEDQLPASISAAVLDAGPGSIRLPILLAGSPATLALSSVRLKASIGSSSTPLTSNGNPPGHLASENLDPTLQTFFGTMGTGTGAPKMCGNISALSLSLVPAPAALLAGPTACTQSYNVNNSFLDVLVGGCTVLGFVAIAPTQPDQEDPAVAPAGDGPPYTLSANGSKQVAACRDHSNAVVPLGACLADAAYSSFFKFTADRVRPLDGRPVLLKSSFESGDFTGWSPYPIPTP